MPMIEVDGEKRAWSEGMTVASLLKELDHTEYCAVVRLNGRLVSSPFFSKTPVKDQDIIRIIPLVAGG